MEILITLIIIVLFCLLYPWILCYFNKVGNPFSRYLDWVYDIVNRKG